MIEPQDTEELKEGKPENRYTVETMDTKTGEVKSEDLLFEDAVIVLLRQIAGPLAMMVQGMMQKVQTPPPGQRFRIIDPKTGH